MVERRTPNPSVGGSSPSRPAVFRNAWDSKRARVMKLRREGAVNERVADRSEAEAPSPSRPANLIAWEFPM